MLFRKSAAWVNPSDDEDFRSFGDSLYKVTLVDDCGHHAPLTYFDGVLDFFSGSNDCQNTAPKRFTILRNNSAFVLTNWCICFFSDAHFQDTAPKRITILRSNSAHNSINHGKNRAKITNPNVG